MATEDKIQTYQRLLKRLLPKGWVWDFSPDSKLSNLISGLAAELARVDDAASNLLVESDPRTTFDLLTDWERVVGLPDACTGLAPTISERRFQIVAKLIRGGTQNKQFFVDLAASLGYTITVDDIEEHDQFRVGINRVGDRLSNGSWVYAISITVPKNTIRPFRVGFNSAGERLVEFGDDVLECVINDNKPAHAVVIFKYV